MKSYVLPTDWEFAVTGWCEFLTAGGHSADTIRVRRAMVRRVAALSSTTAPEHLVDVDLVALCARQPWQTDHRRNVRASLMSFYDWCVWQRLVDTNPAAALPKVGESKPRPRPATDTIWSELLRRARPRERLMARLAAEAGLRRAEVAQVRTDDLIEDGSGPCLIVRGKGARQRVVPINHDLADTIRAMPPGFLFPNGDTHLSPNCVGKLISGLMPAGWSMHKLRHRYASRGFAGTHNLVAVQRALGHASLATTQRYVAASTDEVRAVSESAA